LVVDDDELNRIITADLLRDSDTDSGTHFILEVDTAVDGLDALQKLQSGVHYDCVVTDIIMPRLDGRQLCRQMRDSDEYRVSSVPVVGLTGCASEADIKSSLDSGMVACLPKPVDLRTLTGAVTSAIQEREQAAGCGEGQRELDIV
jgi:CheY-like chemotaxis protein